MARWIYVDVVGDDEPLQLINTDQVVRARPAPDVQIKDSENGDVRGTLMLYMRAGGHLRILATLQTFTKAVLAPPTLQDALDGERPEVR